MKILKIEKDNGWVTKVTYRKTLNDLVFEQSNKERKMLRRVYFFDKDKDVIKLLRDFLNNLEDKKQLEQK